MDIYDIIDAKVVRYGEIVVCLFEHCNLKCVFCPQDHKSILGASHDEIMAKVDPIVKWINNNPRKQSYKIHIMGGELFQDRWIDDGFIDTYEDFIKAIDEQTEADIYFNFITNLCFDNVTEVMYFLARNDLKFSISYDPAGRFSKSDLDKFTRNIRYFQDYIQMK